MPRVATAVLEARGAFRKNPQRRPKDEPDSGRGIGPAPDYLPAEVRAIWDETVFQVAPGVFQSGDRQALEDYCQLRADARRDFAKFPIRRLYLMRAFMQEFGMTPASRSRVHVPKKPPKNGEAPGLAKFVQ